jgi:two-component system NtrC family sensor kinase
MPSMKVGTRLLVYLLPTVTAIMVVYAGLAMRERERILAPVARQEAHAYANTLALTFAFSLRDVDRAGVTTLLNRLSTAPTIFGVKIYDTTGASWFSSEAIDSLPPPPSDRFSLVLSSDTAISFTRQLKEQTTVSVLRTIKSRRGRVIGVLEVAESPGYLVEAQGAVRRRFAITTFTLLAGVSLVTLWLVRRVVTKPLDRLLTATRSLGRGDLATRVPDELGDGEIRMLVRELNGMAMNLEAARRALVRESDERVLLERRVRANEQLATIGRLAAGLAHEIAAPLNVISGRAEILLAKAGSRGDEARSLRIIVDQIRRITSIVSNLLDFARRPEPRRRRLDLMVVIEGVLDFLEAELVAIGVSVERPSEVALWIDGDPDQLHQVFVNLFLNAIQSLEQVDGPRRLRIEARLERGGDDELATLLAAVVILDNGPGIPAEILPRVFDPFVTTKPSGTGLGLVVAKSLVEAHGGAIIAGNREAEGAEFRVTFPAAPLHETVYA